jgi:Xaa-Pro aminopeptidase
MGEERVLEEMARRGVDVLLLGREGNARYVSGARRLFLAGERAFAPGCVVVREPAAVHVLSNSDFGIPDSIPHEHLYPTSWNPATTLGRVAAISGVMSAERVGVDGLTPLFDALLADILPGAELVDGEGVMREARRLKSPEEIALIRAAAAAAQAVVTAASEAVDAGGTEETVKAVAMEAMAARGVTTAAFEPLVGRHRDSDRVTVAVGVLREGWEADLTRTVPGPDRPDALTAAIARCRPGAAVAELGADVHGVGIGYEVLRPAAVLEPAMVLSVGADGAREVVLVTEHDPEILTAPSL